MVKKNTSAPNVALSIATRATRKIAAGRKTMSEYTFDASLTVEADSTEDAENLILDHLMDADIACSLYVDGTMNVKELQRKYEALVDQAHDAIQTDFENGVSWLSEKAAIDFREKYPAIHALINALLENNEEVDDVS